MVAPAMMGSNEGSPTSWSSALARVATYAEGRYGIAVRVADARTFDGNMALPPTPLPPTGRFDGERIAIDGQLAPELALFVMAHLFGHTVQWCCSSEDRELGLSLVDRDALQGYCARHGMALGQGLDAMVAYEREASRLGLTLLQEAGLVHVAGPAISTRDPGAVVQLDAWMADWWRADRDYLLHYYRTGQQADVWALRGTSGERLAPRPIPPFTPRRWPTRWAF